VAVTPDRAPRRVTARSASRRRVAGIPDTRRNAAADRCGRQHGAVLATCLALLLITALLATAGMREATLELAKTGSEQAAMLAFAAAQTGLTLILAADGFERTDRRTLAPAVLPDGTTWQGEVGFLGVAPLPVSDPAAGPEATDVAWHFLVAAEGRGPRGAWSRQRLQVYVRAAPPGDLAGCLDPGCAVPIRCPPPPDGCEGAPAPTIMPVAWHVAEDAP
jgi:hypothetical protein